MGLAWAVKISGLQQFWIAPFLFQTTTLCNRNPNCGAVYDLTPRVALLLPIERNKSVTS